MRSVRVLIVDDHPLVRRGIGEILADEPGVVVVGEAGDGQEAMQKTAHLLPDVVLMDINMPGQDGIETTAYLAQQWPQIKVLILTVSEERDDLLRALRVGALGYVLKTASPREIIHALWQVYEGWVLVSPAMAPRLLSDLVRPPDTRPSTPSTKAHGDEGIETHLTLREQETLRLVARGLSNADIAASLVVSENTVKTHVKNILGKLHLKNRREAAVYAARLDPPQSAQGDVSRRDR